MGIMVYSLLWVTAGFISSTVGGYGAKFLEGEKGWRGGLKWQRTSGAKSKT